MKNIKFIRVVIAGFALMALFFCGRSFAEDDSTRSDIQKILETQWQLYKGDRQNFDGGLAMQILSPKGDYFISTGLGGAISNKSHFRIASVTKTFTAAGIMLLQQKGLLKIKDKVTDNIPGTEMPYLPNTPEYDIPYKKVITIRMLLMHRAGIFDISNNVIPDNDQSKAEPYVKQNYIEYMEGLDKAHDFTFDELLGVNAKNKLSFFEPGTSYHYSDTGYSLLGKIIERVSGKSYEDFIKDELLTPNGLLDTTLPSKGADQKLPEPFVKGYAWMPEKLEEVTESNMSPHVANGNIITTPIDLANWCKKLFTGTAGLTKESVEMMKIGMERADGTPSTYGLGILYTPGIGYGHSGAHAGYLTLMYYDPKTDISYCMFTNIWDVQRDLESIKTELMFMTDTAFRIIKKLGY
jgi:Beta-lactamase class C and other penicillin binding proteins